LGGGFFSPRKIWWSPLAEIRGVVFFSPERRAPSLREEAPFVVKEVFFLLSRGGWGASPCMPPGDGGFFFAAPREESWVGSRTFFFVLLGRAPSPFSSAGRGFFFFRAEREGGAPSLFEGAAFSTREFFFHERRAAPFFERVPRDKPPCWGFFSPKTGDILCLLGAPPFLMRDYCGGRTKLVG